MFSPSFAHRPPRPTSESACDAEKIAPQLLQRGRRDSPFCKVTPLGGSGLAIFSPPPCTPLLGGTQKAGIRCREEGHGFMMRRQVRPNKAHPHLGCEPLPNLEIYDEDDTADYSRLLERIGHGPALGEVFSVCIRVYDMANGRLVTQFCFWLVLHQTSVTSSFSRGPPQRSNLRWTNDEWRDGGMKE